MTRAQEWKEGIFPLFIIIGIILGCIITGVMVFSNQGVIELTTGEKLAYLILIMGGSALISIFSLLHLNISTKVHKSN